MKYIIVDGITGDQITWYGPELAQIFDSREEAEEVIDNSVYWYHCEIKEIQ